MLTRIARQLGLASVSLFVFSAVFLFVQPVMAGTETQITSSPEREFYPDIDGSKIVWQDNRNGNWDIYMYDLSTNTEIQLTNNVKDQRLPKISGNRVVWQDSRNTLDDIYMYDLSTNMESRITTNFTGHSNPDIDGTNIVFEENSAIYVYNTTLQSKQVVVSAAGAQYGPRISSNNIVWYDYRAGSSNPDIYLYNLNSQTETQITTDTRAQETPEIDGNIIVWADKRNNNTFDIYTYNLATLQESRITTDISSDQIIPKISGHRITWTDYGANYGVYSYDLTAEIATKVGPFGATYSAVSANKIVWMDQRNGNFDIYMYDLNPNIAPTAQISSAPVVTLGQATSFDGSDSSDSDGTITNYGWDFGDGTIGDGANVNHTYASAGTYQAMLTVTDDDGATATATTSVLMNASPVAVIAPVLTVTLGVASTFDGSASSDSDGTISSYLWNFGDGNTGSGQMTSHTYTAAGTYQAILTVTDNYGTSSTALVSARVNALPIANIAPIQTVIVGEATTLNGSGSSDSDGVVVIYAWDFGDGSLGSGATVSHTYAAAGVYQALLTVTDDDGATATTTGSAVVHTPSQAINDLVDLVQSMNLAQGITNSLDAKLQNASDALNAMNSGSTNSAVSKLQAFINAVQAQSGNQLTVEQANQLIDAANRIIAAI